ncbi:hypothetical protein FN846DRAFT_894727 [Sphaerosporella brunnea]|uniref:Uncharacterized protein n=1 Tax=Sphaerosporella brunnea TaxID=1250544 RepID=A0A5J5EHW9_9PEZI|nr:hypothetical protein FN846DRAFT_894727 [Sphaerosporella brunnea]
MTLPRSTIRLHRHAQRLSAGSPLPLSASSGHRVLAVPGNPRNRKPLTEEQPAAVPAAFRQLSSAAGANRRSHPSWKLLNQVRKQDGQLNARNVDMQQEITTLKDEITGL